MPPATSPAIFGLFPGKITSPRTLGILTSQCSSTCLQKKSIREFSELRSSSTAPTVVKKSTNDESLSSLSALPIGMLLRSLFVASISSNRFLLLPSLSILSFLSKPGRGFLFDVDRNPVLHAILKKTFYNQFCAGESEEETKACVRQLKDLGFRGIILTYARETVFDHRTKTEHGLGVAALESEKGVPVEPKVQYCANIEAWRTGMLNTADLIEEGDYLAIKLTGAGPTVTAAFAAGEAPPRQMFEALEEVATRCKDRNIRIIIDAESQHFQKGIANATLELMRKFNRDGFAVVYNTYQAYLKSTPTVLAQHLAAAAKDGFTLGLKLVRGAYILSDDRSLIHDTKKDTDDAYNNIAQGALRQHIGEFGAVNGRPFPTVNLFLASHNRDSVLAAHRLHQQRIKANLPTVPIAFGQLHGMSDEVSFSLLREKAEDQVSPEVFKCSTWGSMSECLAYLLRRAVENRDAVLRTGDEYAAIKGELKRRLKAPFFY